MGPFPCRNGLHSWSMLRFLALGDSYTAGEGVSPEECWPALLANLLRDQGMPVASPKIIARTGWTTRELIAAIDAAQLSKDHALVTLLIGVNDQYRGRSVRDYAPQFSEALGRAVACASDDPSRVIVVSIPDWGATPFAETHDRDAIAREIGEFNTAGRAESLNAGAQYVDVTTLSREVRLDASLLASDALHPSPRMYKLWAQAVAPTAHVILRRTSARL